MRHLIGYYFWTQIGVLAVQLKSRVLMELAVGGMRRCVTALDAMTPRPEFQKLWAAVNQLQALLDDGLE